MLTSQDEASELHFLVSAIHSRILIVALTKLLPLALPNAFLNEPELKTIVEKQMSTKNCQTVERGSKRRKYETIDHALIKRRKDNLEQRESHLPTRILVQHQSKSHLRTITYRQAKLNWPCYWLTVTLFLQIYE